MITLILLFTLTFILISLYLLSIQKFDYWKKKNVPHLKPTPVFGNYKEYILFRRFLGEVSQDICKKFPDSPYVGTYYGTEPALMVKDPDLIKLILAKDFVYFNGREITAHTHKETITQNLFFTYGDRWKILRQSMSPIFTSAKIKNMFHLVQTCAKKFEEMLERETKGSRQLEARNLIARYTMDCICSAGFGIDVNTMDPDVENNFFFKLGALIFLNTKFRGFLLYARTMWPSIFYRVGFTAFPKEITEYFRKVLIKVFQDRDYKPAGRNDFVDMSLNLRKNGQVSCESIEKPGEIVNLETDDDFLVLQSVVFFAAGFETSATTLSYALFELAKDSEAQQRAMKEVDEYLKKHDGKIEFDCTTDLPFLNAVVDETLRLYPVLALLTREVMTAYTLPDGLRLERGDRIHVPIYHLHHSPEFFPEPEKFQPERFLPENKHNIRPYTYLPFGEGPRICIGMRIAKMQMMPGLITVLKNYSVEVGEGMPRKIEFDSCSLVTTSVHGVKLKFIKRQKA